MNIRIPLQKPLLSGRELEYMTDVMQSGGISTNGRYTQKCQGLLESGLLAQKVFLTNSCTAALEMAAILSDIGDGDEVILSSYAHVSTANAFFLRGGRPVFVDIRPDTMNIDERKIERAVTERTKAIVPLHYAGVGCEMDAIMDIAGRHGLLVVEDAAQGVYARYKGRSLGTIGQFGAISFHNTKNITSGEGGAILVNAPEYVERAEIVRDMGTDRNKFMRGEVQRYTWQDIGSSYNISEVLAALLLAQLESESEIHTSRRELYGAYCRLLAPLEDKGHISLPVIPEHCSSNYHIFHVTLAEGVSRGELVGHLGRLGIQAASHFEPLHLSPLWQSLGGAHEDLPVTESVSPRLLRLPLYAGMRTDDVNAVAEAVADFFGES